MADSPSGHMRNSVGPGGFRTHCSFGVAGPYSVGTCPPAGMGAVGCVVCLLEGDESLGTDLDVRRNSGNCTVAARRMDVSYSAALGVVDSSLGVLSCSSVSCVAVVGPLDGGWGIEEAHLDLGG